MKTFFKNGAITNLLDIVKNESDLLIVSSSRAKKDIENLFIDYETKNNHITFYEDFSTNPSITDLENALKSLKSDYKFIIAYGGGSAIDFAKYLKFFFNNLALQHKHTISSFIKDNKIYRAKPTSRIKLIAIPTTSGTGSEVTNFATIWDKSGKKKYSLLHESIYPDYAIIDPQLTLSLPILDTISTGLDAINQAFESLWNKNADSESKKMAYEAVAAGIYALPKLIQNKSDLSLRYKMSKSSHLAGKCINKTRTAICHSISYPITAYYNVPHGIACAFSMESVLNLIKQKRPDLYIEIEENINIGNLIEKVQYLNKATNFKSILKDKVGEISNLQDISDEMFTPGRADNFILPINKDTIDEIIISSWEG